jgi:hypothetical protein
MVTSGGLITAADSLQQIHSLHHQSGEPFGRIGPGLVAKRHEADDSSDESQIVRSGKVQEGVIQFDSPFQHFEDSLRCHDAGFPGRRVLLTGR